MLPDQDCFNETFTEFRNRNSFFRSNAAVRNGYSKKYHKFLRKESTPTVSMLPKIDYTIGTFLEICDCV